MRGKKAVIGFLSGVYDTQKEAADAHDLNRQNLKYWFEQYAHLDLRMLKNMAEEAGLKKTISMSPMQDSEACGVTTSLEKGSEGHDEAYKEAFKWVGLEMAKKNHRSVHVLAKEAKKRFNLKTFHRTNCIRAARNLANSPKRKVLDQCFRVLIPKSW